MAISRRTDYAFRLLAALANSDGEPLSVRTAAEDQDVPYAFARSIQHDLVVSGLVNSRRGAHGGIVLARPIDQITPLDVIYAIQGPLAFASCTREEGWCPREGTCPFHGLWVGADRILSAYFDQTTLGELLEHGSGHVPPFDADAIATAVEQGKIKIPSQVKSASGD
jgi:Rrf2 family nitric oxide-sensitive transcriptional repressor